MLPSGLEVRGWAHQLVSVCPMIRRRLSLIALLLNQTAPVPLVGAQVAGT